MTDQNFDFDFLARETLALTEQLRKESFKKDISNLSDKSEQFELNLFDSAFDFSHHGEDVIREVEGEEEDIENRNIEESKELEEVELSEESTQDLAGPGIIYKLERGISTFCLRGLATSDMDYELDALERGDRNLLKKLRLTQEDSLDDLGFFPTYDEAFAETIIDQLINRRFPRQEAIVCNLSDPGFSWWLSCENLSFEVYFQSHGIERDENLIQLGPLGDPYIAYQFFKKSFSFFKSKFSINEFSATEKGFSVSCSQNSEVHFQQLVQLFIDGNFPWDDSAFNKGTSPDKALLLYFYELSLLRRFWVDIQSRLNQ